MMMITIIYILYEHTSFILEIKSEDAYNDMRADLQHKRTAISDPYILRKNSLKIVCFTQITYCLLGSCSEGNKLHIGLQIDKTIEWLGEQSSVHGHTKQALPGIFFLCVPCRGSYES